MNRIFISSLLVLFFSVSGLGQSGFNNTYDFNLPALRFNNITLKEDTLILYGIAIDTATLQQGLLFAKLDTFGNILDHKVHYDSLGDNYILETNYELLKTSDGGYAAVGNLSARNWGILMKLDENFNQEFVREYPDPGILNVNHRKVIEVQNGYMVSGYKQQPNYVTDIFVMKTDLEGNQLWQEFYGEWWLDDVMGSFLKLDENTFYIGAGQGSSIVSNPDDFWGQSKIICIDSTGMVKSEWLSPIDSEVGVVGLNYTSDKGWIYASKSLSILPDGSPEIFNKVIRRDSSFNLLWEKQISFTSGYLNTSTDLVPTTENNWVAAGKWFHAGSPGFWGGGLYKLTDSGDSIWSRLDTAFWHPVIGGETIMGGLVALPSGSICAAGYSTDFGYTDRQYGWLIKVDKNGCLDTLCLTTGLSPMLNTYLPISIYPNPATTAINIDFEAGWSLEIYNNQGMLIKRDLVTSDQTEVDVSDFNSGMYVLVFKKEGKQLVRKFVKIE